MHAVALYWFPELPRSWVRYQFEKGGAPNAMKAVEKFAYNPYYRQKYEHLARENLKFIGLAEVDAFYERYPPNMRRRLPSWAIIIANDLIKKGHTRKDIAKRWGLQYEQFITTLKTRNIFFPPAYPIPNPNWGVRGDGIIRPPKHVMKPKRRKRKKKCVKKSSQSSTSS